MILETGRMVLRPWKESDAESLYEYAKNPLIGPAAGWPAHTSVENSRQIIRDVLLSADNTFAITLKEALIKDLCCNWDFAQNQGKKRSNTSSIASIFNAEFGQNSIAGMRQGFNQRFLIEDDVAIGSVGLMVGDKSNLAINADEAEIGYWIGQPFWGQGLVPEAVREIVRHAFEELNVSVVWCGYFEGNEKSKRVNEKCGFVFHHTEYNKEWPLINATKTQHVTRITRKHKTNDTLPGL